VKAAPSAGFLDALRDLSAALDELGSPAMIIGGVAVIAHGVPRLTVDIDATVVAAGVSPGRASAALARHGIHPRIPDAEAFAAANHVFLATHSTSGTPVDLSFAWLPFEESALARAEAVDYAGVAIRVARPQDLVIYKLVAARPRDIDDAEALLVLYGTSMDLGLVKTVVGEYATLLDDEERPRILAELIKKVGRGRS
jgi:uncharacterized nucleotidyltransferase DUF6036